MLNLNHLRYFYVTAQMKSVTKAAEFFSISQPSLSQQLTVFEEKIGFPLYYRNGRSLDLTPKGKMLYDKAVSIFVSIDEIADFVGKKQTSAHHLYSVAVCDEIERPFISEIIGKLVHLKISENYKYDVTSKPQLDLVPEFYNSRYDLLFTNRLLKKSKPVKVFEFPVNLVTSIQNETIHKLKDSNVKGMLAGLSERLVLPSEGLSLREETDDFLYDFDMDLEVAFESNILGCVTRAIRQGAGCGFLPVPYIYEDLKHKKISVLGPKKGFWQHKIYVYSKKPIEEDAVSQKIVNTIQNYLNFD